VRVQHSAREQILDLALRHVVAAPQLPASDRALSVGSV
jgi:hypothetical protein